MTVDVGSVEDRREFTVEGIVPLSDHEGNAVSCRTTVRGELTRMGGRLLLTASVSGRVRVECSRCTGTFDMPVEAEFSIVFHRGQIPQGFDEDDIVPLADVEDNLYDLFPRVREAVILEVPIRFLCSEQCKGLCPRCGVNLNESACRCGESEGDPRWGPLKKLLNGNGK